MMGMAEERKWSAEEIAAVIRLVLVFSEEK
jgi:hypothetical protein